jgi:hypothetical protein
MTPLVGYSAEVISRLNYGVYLRNIATLDLVGYGVLIANLYFPANHVMIFDLQQKGTRWRWTFANMTWRTGRSNQFTWQFDSLSEFG